MRVGIDLSPIVPQGTGVDTYCKELVKHLARIDSRTRYTLFVNYEDRGSFAGLLPPNFAIIPLSLRPRVVRLFFQQLELPIAAAALDIEVLHSPSFLMPFFRGRQRHFLSIHDMTFFTMPKRHTRLHRHPAFKAAVLSSIRRADLIGVPSRSTKGDILKLLPQMDPHRIKVVAYGVGEDFRAPSAEDVRSVLERLGLPERYILYVGTIEPRKNVEALIASYRRLLGDGDIAEHLVLAGQLGWSSKALVEMLDAEDLRGRVHLTGYVSANDLPSLYAGARMFVYPSLYEGFGLPPLEAMACGTPTIASLSSAMTENLQDAAVLVHPHDQTGLCAAIKRFLRDEGLCAEYRARGLARAAEFRWRKSAGETLSCYRELAATRG
jgi:glycosyltransferase involved in cell wall biosynthesis